MTAAAVGSTARACSKALASLPLSSRLRVRHKRYLYLINAVMTDIWKDGAYGDADSGKRAGE